MWRERWLSSPSPARRRVRTPHSDNRHVSRAHDCLHKRSWVLCAGSRHTTTPHVFLGRTAGRESARRRRPADPRADSPRTLLHAGLPGSRHMDGGLSLTRWTLRSARTTPRDGPSRRHGRSTHIRHAAPRSAPCSSPSQCPPAPSRLAACWELLRLAGAARRTLADSQRSIMGRRSLFGLPRLGEAASLRARASARDGPPPPAPHAGHRPSKGLRRRPEPPLSRASRAGTRRSAASCGRGTWAPP